MKNFLLAAIFLGMATAIPNIALGHTDEYLATVDAPHGGQLRMAGPFHLELVAKDGELELYVTDHMDNEIPTAGGSGKANVFDETGERLSVPLTPVFGNLMKGAGEFRITPETVVSVFVVLEGYETQGARFTPLASKSTAEESAHEHHGHDHHHGDDHNNHGSHEEDE
ncbi:hypothetical protein [Nitrosomonas sp. ANs5]|uniref:hypothetical protein n=1 Tax=Nitrosomonas sp. ANs5 TaxID=3423941 RepID=UPI003D329570